MKEVYYSKRDGERAIFSRDGSGGSPFQPRSDEEKRKTMKMCMEAEMRDRKERRRSKGGKKVGRNVSKAKERSPVKFDGSKKKSSHLGGPKAVQKRSTVGKKEVSQPRAGQNAIQNLKKKSTANKNSIIEIKSQNTTEDAGEGIGNEGKLPDEVVAVMEKGMQDRSDEGSTIVD